MMLVFHVYILRSQGSGKFYIGQTNNLDRRLYEHNNSAENSYTSKYRPWELQISFKTNSRKDSVRLEKYLKKKDRDFIRKIINDSSLQAYIIQRYSL